MSLRAALATARLPEQRSCLCKGQLSCILVEMLGCQKALRSRGALVIPAFLNGIRAREQARHLSEAIRTISVERELPYDRLDVFKVVVDVVKYPEFLPYCTGAKIKHFGHQQMHADVIFSHRLFQERIHYDVSWKSPSKVTSVATDTKLAKRIEYRWEFEERSPVRTLAKMELDVVFNSISSAFLFDVFSDAIKNRVMQAISDRVREVAVLTPPKSR